MDDNGTNDDASTASDVFSFKNNKELLVKPKIIKNKKLALVFSSFLCVCQKAYPMAESTPAFKMREQRNAMGEYTPCDGGKPLTQLAIPLPGPADYSPNTTLTKPAPPHYSIVGKPKTRMNDDFPGPNEYKLDNSMVWKDRGFSLIGKSKERSQETSAIGPAAYLITNNNIASNNLKATLSRREKIVRGPPDSRVQPVDTHGFQTPGPYRPSSSYWKNNIKKSFGLALKKKEIELGPGPAEYSIHTAGGGPAYSLGKRLVQKTGDDNPGPGAYTIPTTIGKAVAKSISSRLQGLSNLWAPSPNTYNVPSTLGSGPKYSMTYRAFERAEVPAPGPASYKRNMENLSKQPVFSCRKQSRPVYPDILNYSDKDLMNNVGVGPNSYNVHRDFSKNDAPAYSMGKRFITKSEETPGPSTYNTNKMASYKTNGATAYSIGVRIEMKANTTGPGPAAYIPKTKPSGPQYSMSGRSKLQKSSNSPGANSYFIQSGQTNRGINKGPKITLKGRPSPFVYSGMKHVFAN